MGKCYQQAKEYHNAIKCFKKMLEIAWQIDNVDDEMNAYEMIGLQYYYLNDLERSKYYHSRMQRGRQETKDSKIRKIYISNAQQKRDERRLGL